MNCHYCHQEFEADERVIYSSRERFVFKPAHVPDTVNAAKVSPQVLAESRKDHMREAVVNVFVDWGKVEVPKGAFGLRHVMCEPQRTGHGQGGHAIGKHAIRYGRAAPGRLHG